MLKAASIKPCRESCLDPYRMESREHTIRQTAVAWMTTRTTASAAWVCIHASLRGLCREGEKANCLKEWDITWHIVCYARTMDCDDHMIQLGEVLPLFLTMYQKHSTLAHWRVKDSFKLGRSFLVILLADVIDGISNEETVFWRQWTKHSESQQICN